MSNNKISTNKTSTTNQPVKKPTYSSTTFITIVGVLILLYISVYLYNSYKAASLLATTITIPYSMCPNYWDSLGNNKCQNTNSLGLCNKGAGSNIMDFSGDIFNNVNTGNYAKCKWASACNVSWSNIDRLC